jgi:hypothetical protein
MSAGVGRGLLLYLKCQKGGKAEEWKVQMIKDTSFEKYKC